MQEEGGKEHACGYPASRAGHGSPWQARMAILAWNENLQAYTPYAVRACLQELQIARCFQEHAKLPCRSLCGKTCGRCDDPAPTGLFRPFVPKVSGLRFVAEIRFFASFMQKPYKSADYKKHGPKANHAQREDLAASPKQNGLQQREMFPGLLQIKNKEACATERDCSTDSAE